MAVAKTLKGPLAQPFIGPASSVDRNANEVHRPTKLIAECGVEALSVRRNRDSQIRRLREMPAELGEAGPEGRLAPTEANPQRAGAVEIPAPGADIVSGQAARCFGA